MSSNKGHCEEEKENSKFWKGIENKKQQRQKAYWYEVGTHETAHIHQYIRKGRLQKRHSNLRTWSWSDTYKRKTAEKHAAVGHLY
ncbi:hypothetical protein MPTK1_6g08440 [Marchantia polymorpha subsp. ruderalis]|uniref:Uncharacterized protein n=2 Tax=Marchantia polymorpha TaxID=3197 RepID=A0AAF6BPW6_MARPO|nr:hypothetical protein MARPO_0060s0077 [Marchantia polymorpha]BBN14050.1 hypothetical protein Mp_6g08440 [Marchantia polymorpha subsp. ruderalis]|eukprot:PTQ36995.1 hypothetical protein MARPO_0060s0077 [Marchantia polymorpha]